MPLDNKEYEVEIEDSQGPEFLSAPEDRSESCTESKQVDKASNSSYKDKSSESDSGSYAQNKIYKQEYNKNLIKSGDRAHSNYTDANMNGEKKLDSIVVQSEHGKGIQQPQQTMSSRGHLKQQDAQQADSASSSKDIKRDKILNNMRKRINQ